MAEKADSKDRIEEKGDILQDIIDGKVEISEEIKKGLRDDVPRMMVRDTFKRDPEEAERFVKWLEGRVEAVGNDSPIMHYAKVMRDELEMLKKAAQQAPE